MLEILFEDDHYIAINKPAGLLVHKTKIAKNDDPRFAMQMLRDQIGQWVYPLHRIDRPPQGFCCLPNLLKTLPCSQRSLQSTV